MKEKQFSSLLLETFQKEFQVWVEQDIQQFDLEKWEEKFLELQEKVAETSTKAKSQIVWALSLPNKTRVYQELVETAETEEKKVVLKNNWIFFLMNSLKLVKKKAEVLKDLQEQIETDEYQEG